MGKHQDLLKEWDKTDSRYDNEALEGEDWFIAFPIGVPGGEMNRMKILRTFLEFWHDLDAKEIRFAGDCMLGCRVYSHPEYQDGTSILTSKIKTIKRLGATSARGGSDSDFQRFQVETTNGSRYSIHGYRKSRLMDSMMEDYINDSFNYDPGAYVPLEYKKTNSLL